jgi:hypothetical protein
MANAIFSIANLCAFAVNKLAKAQSEAKMNQSQKLCREVVGRRNTLGLNHYTF